MSSHQRPRRVSPQNVPGDDASTSGDDEEATVRRPTTTSFIRPYHFWVILALCGCTVAVELVKLGRPMLSSGDPNLRIGHFTPWAWLNGTQKKPKSHEDALLAGSSKDNDRRAQREGNPLPTMGVKKKKNVLFMIADDMRPSLSPYDVPSVMTPNFDRLAAMSTLFERVYNQDPICNPSRNSLLSGRRPDTTRVWLFESEYPREFISLYAYLKKFGGYKLYGSGKVEHWLSSSMELYEEYFPSASNDWWDLMARSLKRMNATVWPDSNWPENEYIDAQVTEKAIEYMKKAAKEYRDDDQPFFLGIGYHLPHRPWHLPKRFWDQYEGVPIGSAPHPHRPVGAPHIFVGDIDPSLIKLLPDGGEAYSVYDHVRVDKALPAQVLSEQMRGYYASISFTDYNMGRVLDALEQDGLMDDTIIVWAVDHGLNIGDHALFDKRTLLETTTRVPLFIYDPSRPQGRGKRVSGIVENVDIYPTIIEMTGLQQHAAELWPPLEGASLVPLIRSNRSTFKDFAVSQIARCCKDCRQHAVKDVPWQKWVVCTGNHNTWGKTFGHVMMGYSIRTDFIRGFGAWRYNVWRRFNGSTYEVDWSDDSEFIEELYDHHDPRCNTAGGFDLCEDVNFANSPGLELVKTRLRESLGKFVSRHSRRHWDEVKAANRSETSTDPMFDW